MVRDNRTAFLLSFAAVLCLAATQVIFWMFTYPINAASNSWTTMPANFEVARRQWEYSHAVNAVLTFVALVAITLSVFADKARNHHDAVHSVRGLPEAVDVVVRDLTGD
jgi:hypothetical protein